MFYLSGGISEIVSGVSESALNDMTFLFDSLSATLCNAQDTDQHNALDTDQRNAQDIDQQQKPGNEEPQNPDDECINIDSLTLKGNSSFSNARLKMRMKSWHSSLLPGNFNCYNEEWLKKDILSLIEFYRTKGFPDVEIDYFLNRSVAGKYIIEINISEGLKYEIVFNGNSYFSDRELEKKIDLVKKGNPDDSALNRARVDIKNSYVEAGFQDVIVELHKDIRAKNRSGKTSDNDKNENSQKSGQPADNKQHMTDTQVWHIEFAINEGTRMVVNHLEIKGNKIVPKNEIMAAVLTRQKGTLEKGGYNSKVLDKDINAIELLYLSKGFLNAVVSKEILTREASSVKMVDITISINEGVQTLVTSARIKGIERILVPEKAMAKLSLGPGEPFREYMVKSDENAIGMMISELGYPHVKVHSSVAINSDKSKADILWEVKKGGFTRFGDIHYSGNTRLKKNAIEQRVKITPGAPFSLRKVFATEKSIRESPAVKYVQVKAPGLAKMEESPDIEVVIEENKPYFVEAAAGYDSEKNFYLDSKVGDNNFLGREIDAWVAANVSGIGYRAESGLKKPFFLGTKIDATANIYIEDKEELNKSFGTKAWGYESGFSRQLFIKNIMAGLNLKYENRTTYGDIEDIDINTDELEPRNILITSFIIGYDSRDSSVRPSRGILSSASVDVYTGFDNDLDRFLKYQLDLRKYTSPLNKVTFALRTRMGYIQPLGSEDIVAQDQLFFLGGTPNIRGFKENMLEYDLNGKPAGGHTSINSSLEARIDLPADFELNCFVDTGRVDDLAKQMESRGFRSSVGAGLRYVTPIGPVGLLYGHKLDTEDGESPGRIHFSVGYTF
ncbi:MAG: BamA/TamA family outer membrane protein [Desulfamplus sp.]|nr:BamA/TamA family outer membrane protein [Desulfamplus sp.]